jgi:hypothetical protein
MREVYVGLVTRGQMTTVWARDLSIGHRRRNRCVVTIDVEWTATVRARAKFNEHVEQLTSSNDLSFTGWDAPH